MNRLAIPLLLAVVGTLYFPSCQKNASSQPSQASQSLIQEARAYFNNSVLDSVPTATSTTQDPNPRATGSKAPDWPLAHVIEFNHRPAVLIPVRYAHPFLMMTSFSGSRLFDINRQTQLLIFKDSLSVFHAQVVSSFPDSACRPGGPFTGVILVDDWNGRPISRYQYDGSSIRAFKPTTQNSASSISHTAPSNFIQAETTCTIIYGYNYAADGSSVNYWEEDVGCSTDVIDGGDPAANYAIIPSSGAGSAGGSGGGLNFSIPRGNSPITNVADYIKCLKNDPKSTYQVTLYVDQPTPGSRVPFSIFGQGVVPSAGSSGVGSSQNGSGINAGHTFLQFQQVSGSQTITRSMGLFPRFNCSPIHPTSLGSLNDDENHQYNISLSIILTGDQFMNVLNFCAQGNATEYNLNTNNCTTWALNSLAAGGVYIYTKPGVWPLGEGDDPGDLGEDIRSMKLAPNMSLNAIAGNATANNGTCN